MYGAKVSWKEACAPKQEGGLGLYSTELWNECLIMKLIWKICSKKDYKVGT